MVYIEEGDDYIIKVGRNKEENTQLIIQHQKKYDKDSSDDKGPYWFHLKGMPSPHAIVFTKDLTFFLIEKAANLVKQFSKAKNLKEISVEYLPLKFVKCTKNEGEVELLKNPKKIIV